MHSSIEPGSMFLDDQRLLDQTAIDGAFKKAVFHIVFIRLQSTLDQTVLNANSNGEKRHLKESDGLRLRKIRKGLIHHPLLNPVTNLSSRILTDEERAALANGLHHVYLSQ